MTYNLNSEKVAEAFEALVAPQKYRLRMLRTNYRGHGVYRRKALLQVLLLLKVHVVGPADNHGSHLRSSNTNSASLMPSFNFQVESNVQSNTTF